jgi:hypothetical protein
MHGFAFLFVHFSCIYLRQFDSERAAVARFRLDGDLAAVLFDNIFGDIQTQTKPDSGLPFVI